MNFRDRTLVSLASEDLRGGLLTNVALTNIAETAYRIEPGSMSAPWSATFDKLRIAPSFETHEQARAEMAFDANTGRIDGRLDRISQGELGVGPDAIWQGAVIGQGRVGGGRIAEVSGSFVGLGDVDQVIDSAGGVPAAGAARDDARLIEIARRLTDAAGVTGEIGPKDVADWVARSGAADLTTFLSETSTTEIGGGFGIRFISEAPGVDVPVQLTVDAVIHVADPDTNESSLDPRNPPCPCLVLCQFCTDRAKRRYRPTGLCSWTLDGAADVVW